MKNRFLVIASLFLLAGCERDFSVNAEYKDFPIVLGLVKASDNTHYVKVYKSFVTEHSAYDAAKDIHLYSYIDSVEVYLEEYDAKGTLIRKIVFDTTTEISKDSGIFAFPTQILYKANAELDINYTYKLLVYNYFTKKMAYSQPIPLVGDAIVRKPSTTLLSVADGKLSIEYIPAKNAHLFEFALTFYYSETMKDNTVQQGKPVTWTLGQQRLQTSSNGIVSYSVSSGSVFFQRIASGIVDNENVVSRHTDSIVLSVFSAGKDWYLYLLANRPSSGINQNRLDYSNIFAYNTESKEEQYALGLFSSREISTQAFRDFSTPSTRDSLFYGRYTKHLKFTNIY